MNEYKVSLEKEGKRLDVFLTDVMEGSRSYIQSLIKSGHVLVNGKVGKANLRLNADSTIFVDIPEPEEVEILPEDIPVEYLMKITILLSSTSLVAWLYIQQLAITQER